jgi:hypothetical protein
MQRVYVSPAQNGACMTSAKLWVPMKVRPEVHEKVKRSMAERYGGFTAYGANGGWIDGDGNLIEERTRVYEVVAPSTADGGDMYNFILKCAQDVKDMSDESAVLAYLNPSADSEGEKILVE